MVRKSDDSVDSLGAIVSKSIGGARDDLAALAKASASDVIDGVLGGGDIPEPSMQGAYSRALSEELDRNFLSLKASADLLGLDYRRCSEYFAGLVA